MTLPDPQAPPKPRRAGLYAPFVLLIVAAALWSGAWLWLSHQFAARMDAARAASGAGGTLAWSGRRIGGYPFRLDVNIDGLVAAEPSGWALAIPRLEAESSLLMPGRWVAVAPRGMRVTRPGAGGVTIGAKVLRASLSDAGGHPPRFSLEGNDLTFTTSPGAKPFFLSSAGELHFHTRAAPSGLGEARLEIVRATARPDGALGLLSQGKPVELLVDAMVSDVPALAGRSWPQVVRNWSGSGGALDIRRLRLRVGEVVASANAGRLAVGGDGRLRGRITVSLGHAPRILAAMERNGGLSPEAAASAAAVLAARAAGGTATVTFAFEAGETTLGPVSIGPAPRVY